MGLSVRVGSIQFEYRGAMTVALGTVELRPLLFADGERVMAAEQDGVSYLIIDHRSEHGPGKPGRVEYCAPSGAAEGQLGGLFVIADTAGPAATFQEVALAQLAAALGREPASAGTLRYTTQSKCQLSPSLFRQ
jgi:hypothetical protein